MMRKFTPARKPKNYPSFYEAPLCTGKIEDITTYCERRKAHGNKPYSHHGQIEVRHNTDQSLTRAGRAMVASTFAGEYLSITLRGGKDKEPVHGLDPYSPNGIAGIDAINLPEDKYELESKPDTGYLVARGKICDLLYKLLFSDGRPNVGLILIAGATSSSKSNIARGLIKLYLDKRIADVTSKSMNIEGFQNTERRPHLVTVENPIEEYRFVRKDTTPRWETPADTQKRFGLDYTPREIGIDVTDLHQALMEDALRQTPSVVYVGELREENELRTALEFATTGHLIVSTMHAGSLVEAMERTFTAMNVRTAQDRGNVASLILGLIHLRGFEIDDKPTENSRPNPTLKVMSPALWRGTSQGVASVVADGLSALLPNRPSINSSDNNQLPACIGRTALLEGLLPVDTPTPELWHQAILRALQEDIKGV